MQGQVQIPSEEGPLHVFYFLRTDSHDWFSPDSCIWYGIRYASNRHTEPPEPQSFLCSTRNIECSRMDVDLAKDVFQSLINIKLKFWDRKALGLWVCSAWKAGCTGTARLWLKFTKQSWDRCQSQGQKPGADQKSRLLWNSFTKKRRDGRFTESPGDQRQLRSNHLL